MANTTHYSTTTYYMPPDAQLCTKHLKLGETTLVPAFLPFLGSQPSQVCRTPCPCMCGIILFASQTSPRNN